MRKLGPKQAAMARGVRANSPPALHTHTHTVAFAHNIRICVSTISAQCVNIYEGLRRGVWRVEGGGRMASESLFFPSPKLSRALFANFCFSN